MARIALEGMEFRSHIGYYQEERKLKGRFLVDVYVETSDIEAAAKEDRLSGTINYENLYSICASVMKESCDLLEYAAKNIIIQVRRDFPEVSEATVRVSKLNPPLPGKVTRSFVELNERFDQ